MNIIIFGAGAIGSLFGALLSRNNSVLLIGRKSHVNVIKKSGLIVKGKTKLKVKIDAVDSVNCIHDFPDLLILTVKSYDTESAILEAMKIIDKNTIVLSLQNGLDNIEKIKNHLKTENVIAGITTHGCLFSEPGMINHTGKGKTVLGELNGKKTERVANIVEIFNQAGIEANVSNNIKKEIWIKGIVNSSINPLTTFFQCKNGYLLENPILEKLVEKICRESTDIANAEGIDPSYRDMIEKTKDVIRKTSENYSSMYQSFNKGKKTEIASINGKLVDIGRKHGIETLMNEILTYLVKSVSDQ